MATFPVFRKNSASSPFDASSDPAIQNSEMQNSKNKQEFLVRGEITRVIFEQPEDNFYIFLVRRHQAMDPFDQVKVKGYGYKLHPGQQVDCTGVYENGKGAYKDELTLKAHIISEVIPTGLEGIRRLLHKGYVKGIGPKTADLMLAHYGANLFDVAELAPDRIFQIPGLGEARAKSFVKTITEKKAVPRIMSFLAEIGLGPGLSHRVFKDLGLDAVRKIKSNPYALTSIPLIGFTTADRVARQMGVDPYSSKRIEAGIAALLTNESENGSTAVEVKHVIEETSKMLNCQDEKGPPGSMIKISNEQVEIVLNKVVRDQLIAKKRELKNGIEAVSLIGFSSQESRIATDLARLVHARTRAIRDVDTSTYRFAHLDEDQKQAAKTALTSNVSVITGRPGCGKTTVTKSIIEALNDAGLSYLACGPTGRAAKRFKEATGFDAMTMHRALGSRGAGKFHHDEDNPLEVQFIIADEQSMSDTYLSHKLLRAVVSGAQLLYVGDVDQLPSIGAGTVLKDIIQSGKIPVSTLTNIHRQAAGSDIIINAHRIINGEVPVSRSGGSDFTMIDNFDINTQVDTIISQYKKLIKKGFYPEDIQILTPMRKKTDLGSNILNKKLKEILNPGKPQNSIKRGKFDNEVTFSTGDRIMQVVNNKELGIYNGDIGYIISMDKVADEICVDFSGEKVMMSSEDFDDIDLAYATTIHKSQGSEFPAIIIPMSKSHWMMWDRNLLYTAVTRGKKEVILAGDTYMLKKVVATQNASKRMTGLSEEIERIFDLYDPNVKRKPSSNRSSLKS